MTDTQRSLTARGRPIVARVSEWFRSGSDADADFEYDGGAQRRAVQAWSVALILLCIAVLWLQFRHIEDTLPYPLHVDEGYVSGPAQRTLVTGTLDPYNFSYPSLPKYLAAGAMAAGFLSGAAHLEIRELRQVGSVGYPYYETRRIMQFARRLFVVLSVVALAATGLSAWLAFHNPVSIFLAPLILLTSPLYFFHSWTYLNVDIVGTCFVTLTVASCLAGTRRPTIRRVAIAPSVCAGLAAGSKYTLAVVALPVFLAIGFYLTGTRRTVAWAAALAGTAAAFFLAMPYSLLDIPSFLNGLAFEAFHYASGHRGFNGEPGLSQLLFYLRHFGSEFGVPAAILAVLGVCLYGAADWRRTAIVAILPAALLWLLASQRVHFTRNVLSLHPLFAMFAAFGLVSLHAKGFALAERLGWVLHGARRQAACVFAGLALVVATVPVSHLLDHLRDRTDSRNLARTWIDTSLPSGWTIVVPTQLGFDKRGLESSGRQVMVVNLQAATSISALQSLLVDVPSPAVIMLPRWGADRRYPGQTLANVLNNLSRRWNAVETFGTNDVLVNYSNPTPWGDPAFAIAVLR